MAICDEVQGIEVFVTVQGEETSEYDDPDGPQGDSNRQQARHRVFKYIESLNDARFSIVCNTEWHHFASPNQCLGFFVYIDGKYQDSRVARNTHAVTFDGARRERNGVWKKELFTFSQVQTVDSTERARVEEDKAAAKDLGLIQVHVRKGIEIPDAPCGPRSERPPPQNCVTNIAEKALKGKAISHGTSFADGGVIREPPRISVNWFDDSKPLVTFNFKYRSKESLRMEMVIARSPSPDPDDLEVEGLSQQEIRRLAAERLRSKRAAGVKTEGKSVVKREINEVYDLTDEGVDERPKRAKAEVVDLTGDD